MNQDEWQKFMNVAAPAGGIGFAVAVFRGVIEQQGGWRKWFAGLAAAIVVGIVVGLGLHSTDVPVFMQHSIVIVCSYVARDILMGLTQVSGMVASKPLETIGRIIDFIRGRRGE